MNAPDPDSSPVAKLPFAGLVVVELGNSVAAPFAGQILAELGAEVIKIEKPSGDDARAWGCTTADGEIVVAAGSNGLFRALAKALGRGEWLDDPRFVDNPIRVAHQAELYAMLDEIMRGQPTAHWLHCLEAAGVPCSEVQDLQQMLNHPQTEALALVQSMPGSDMRFVGLPLSIDGRRPRPISAAPTLGQDNATLTEKRTRP